MFLQNLCSVVSTVCAAIRIACDVAHIHAHILCSSILPTALIYGDINVNKENTETAKTKKIHFDRRIREARVRIEGERMCTFILNSLKPAALQLDVDLRDTMAPNLLRQMDMLESQMNRDKSSPIILTTGSSTIFSRLASGRHYQGKLDRMISDLFPSLLEDYNQASQKATEREMMEYVIQHDLVLNHQEYVNNIDLDKEEERWIKKQQEWREKRIKAAYKCLDRFYPLDSEQSTTSEKQAILTEEGLQSGKLCEDSCIAYLTHERDLDEQCIVLQNVYVNNRRGKNTKYVPPKILKTPKDLNGTGIIWAENLDGGGRHRLCSEFDAVVVSKSNDSIESVYEAKKTISPSTIHDILSKKLGAVHTLLDDLSAELVYGDGEMTRTIPFTSSVDSTRFTFGMFGTELQRPEHSADSIRSIAGSYVVSSDVGEIIRALDNMSDDGMVMVEVELTSALSIVESLRSLVEEVRMKRVDVVLIIDKPIDFL